MLEEGAWSATMMVMACLSPALKYVELANSWRRCYTRSETKRIIVDRSRQDLHVKVIKLII